MPPDLTQLAVLRYTWKGSLELYGTKNNRSATIDIAAKTKRIKSRLGGDSQIDVAPRTRQTAHAPDIQVDHGLEGQVVMGLQLDFGCLPHGHGFRKRSSGRRSVAHWHTIVDAVCGFLIWRLQGQWLLWLRDGANNGCGHGFKRRNKEAGLV